MGKEDRKEQVLRLLVESGVAMEPVAIFRNVKVRGATFERRSVNNYLNELASEGYLKKVDPGAMEDGQFEEIPLSERGYFVATDKGISRYDY